MGAEAVNNGGVSDKSWPANRQLIAFQLDQLHAKLDDLQRQVAALHGEILVLKVKATGWGLLGGMVPVALALLVWLFKGVVTGG